MAVGDHARLRARPPGEPSRRRGDDTPPARRKTRNRRARRFSRASPTRSSATSNGAHAWCAAAAARERKGTFAFASGAVSGAASGADVVVRSPQIGVWDVRDVFVRARGCARRGRHRRRAARVRELRGEAAHGGPEPVHEEPLARSQVRVREQRAPRGERGERHRRLDRSCVHARGFGAKCASRTATNSACAPLGANGESAPNTCAPRGNDRALSPRATTSPLTSRPRISGSIGAYSARAYPARTRASSDAHRSRGDAHQDLIGRESRDGHVLGDAHHLGAAERAGHRRARIVEGTRPAMTARLVRERGRECGASAGIREKRRRLSALSSSGGILSPSSVPI